MFSAHREAKNTAFTGNGVPVDICGDHIFLFTYTPWEAAKEGKVASLLRQTTNEMKEREPAEAKVYVVSVTLR